MNPDLERELAKVRVQDDADREAVSLAYRSETIVEAFKDRLPNIGELEEMTKAFGPELVQMALIRILTSIAPNRYFFEHVETVLRDSPDLRPSSILWINKREAPVLSPRELVDRYELCIVASSDPASPGSGWGAHVRDWQHWARLSGMTTEVIETRQSQGLIRNAETIRRFLAEHPHEQRILATLGQGGTEMRLLIDQLERTGSLDEFEGVRAWVNVSGIIRGASGVTHGHFGAVTGSWGRRMESIANSIARSIANLMRGWPSQISHQLSAENARLRQDIEWAGLPFLCVSMVGFPNVTDIPLGQKGQFLKLMQRSPNDGVCLFHEAIVKPGYIVPVPHMSHRAEPMRLAPWFMAAIRALRSSDPRQGPFSRS